MVVQEKEMHMTNNKRRIILKPMILMAVLLALAVAAGISTAAYAQATRTPAVAARPDSFLDPFALARVFLSADNPGKGVRLQAGTGTHPLAGPQITVPARPEYRSLWCPNLNLPTGRNGI